MVTESLSLPPPTGLTRLPEARTQGRLTDELDRLARIPLIVIDEVGYIPFDPGAASLFFSLISSRYERRSLIVTSNKNFSSWAEIFSDAVAVAAIIDRLVHHAGGIVLKGQSYPLRGNEKKPSTNHPLRTCAGRWGDPPGGVLSRV